MPVNAIAMPFSFAAAIDSSSLIDPPRLETGVRLAICDSSLRAFSPREPGWLVPGLMAQAIGFRAFGAERLK